MHCSARWNRPKFNSRKESSPALCSHNRSCDSKTRSSAGSLSRGFRTTFKTSPRVFAGCWTSAESSRLTSTASSSPADRHSFLSCAASFHEPSAPANSAAAKSSRPSPKASPSAPWKLISHKKAHKRIVLLLCFLCLFVASFPSCCGRYGAYLWSVSLVQSSLRLRIFAF